LPFEAIDAAVYVRHAMLHARVVHEIARREVVAAVDDHVETLEDPVDVRAGETLVERLHDDAGIEPEHRALFRVDLALADAIGRMKDLPLQVRLVDDVEVDDAERANAG